MDIEKLLTNCGTPEFIAIASNWDKRKDRLVAYWHNAAGAKKDKAFRLSIELDDRLTEIRREYGRRVTESKKPKPPIILEYECYSRKCWLSPVGSITCIPVNDRDECPPPPICGTCGKEMRLRKDNGVDNMLNGLGIRTT